MELLLACCEVRTKLTVKLGVSLLDFLQKARFGSLSASLDQWSLSHGFDHRGWSGLQPVCDLSFRSVDKLNIVRTGYRAALEFIFLERQ